MTIFAKEYLKHNKFFRLTIKHKRSLTRIRRIKEYGYR